MHIVISGTLSPAYQSLKIGCRLRSRLLLEMIFIKNCCKNRLGGEEEPRVIQRGMLKCIVSRSCFCNIHKLNTLKHLSANENFCLRESNSAHMFHAEFLAPGAQRSTMHTSSREGKSYCEQQNQINKRKKKNSLLTPKQSQLNDFLREKNLL